MAKKTRASKPARTSLSTYFFSPEVSVPEPDLAAAERKRYDELGVIGSRELGEKGFYASIARGTRRGAARARWRLVWTNPDTGQTFISRVAISFSSADPGAVSSHRSASAKFFSLKQTASQYILRTF